MSANLEQAILEKIQALPDDKQQEVLAFVDGMLRKEQERQPRETVRPIWEIIEEISSQAPPGTWDDVPTYSSVSHDHYLCGAPKRQLPLVASTGNAITQQDIDDDLNAD
jgi:hypothetical protein